MLYRIGKAQRVFATRYHATILGIKTGAELIPMAYATKNERLLNELGINSSRFISSGDLAQGNNKFSLEPLVVSEDTILHWENKATNAMIEGIKVLLNSK